VATDRETDLRRRKGAKNQALAREVNERIEEVSGAAFQPEFICECADTGCTESMNMSLAEYEAVRASSTRFPVLPGHEVDDIERVVEQNERYAIVEKVGVAAEVASRLDPRQRQA
jgi:hypothetical protein